LKPLIKYPERNLESREVSKEELVAYHESGHVVMCSKFHLNYTYVSIAYNQETGGHECVETPAMLFESEAFKIWGHIKTYGLAIIQYFSGILSEAFYSGTYDWYNAQDDMESVSFVKNINNSCFTKIDLWKLSEKMVIKNWGQINHLSKVLLDQKILPKNKVEEILKDKVNVLNPPALKMP